LKTVTLLTDFGLKDPYAGIMKGVILTINPDVRIVDITHEIDPQDVREGAFLIEEYYRYFEIGTIHVAVVDPTVGSDRKPIVFSKDGYFFVGPDNGLFTLMYDDTVRVYAIENSRYMSKEISRTFHGRDIFAPAAAHLAAGVQLPTFGSEVRDPVRTSDIYPVIEKHNLKGEVIRFDRFGNAITNIAQAVIDDFTKQKACTIHFHGMSLRKIQKSYYEGEVICLIGSAGYLEFGYFKGNLREKLGLKKGDQVAITIS
jgi:S-adenosyl-L-methionine hydrolase (adenosine-forming)